MIPHKGFEFSLFVFSSEVTLIFSILAMILGFRNVFLMKGVACISRTIVVGSYDACKLSFWSFSLTEITTRFLLICSNRLDRLPEKMVGMWMQPYGIQWMLKEGYRHLSGLQEAVIKHIEACKELSTITRTSLGPNGMNKMVINHLDKLFATNDDAATIVNELEIQHPAAKLLVLAAKAQQEEIGDGANLTISFAGELLQNAEELIRMGLHPSEIVSGYTKAVNKAVEILEELVESGSETMDVRNKDEVISRMRAAVASKQFGQEEIICSLFAGSA